MTDIDKAATELAAQKLPCGGGLCVQFDGKDGTLGVSHSRHCPAFHIPAVAAEFARLMRDRDEARAEIERLRRLAQPAIVAEAERNGERLSAEITGLCRDLKAARQETDNG